MILNSVYFSIISVLSIRFIWIVSYFINKKRESKKARDIPSNNVRFLDIKMIWIWILVAVNSIIRIAIVLINLPLIALSYGKGLSSTEASKFLAVKSVIFAATPVVDIVTALSLLYLYHMLGLKNRLQSKKESGVSFEGLVNTSVRDYNLEFDDEKKELSNQLD